MSIVVADDAVADGHAQAEALADFFGRKKGVEYPGGNRFADARVDCVIRRVAHSHR